MRFVNLKNFSIYFFRLSNCIVLNLLGCKIKANFFYQCFYSFNASTLILKFADKGFFKRLLFILNQVTNSLNIGFYSNLYLKGLGFRIRVSRRARKFKMFKVWLGHSVYKYILPVPLFVFKWHGKFNLLVFTPFLKHFNDFLTHIFLLRVVRPYKKVRGMIDRRTIYFMRPAKVR